MNFAAMCQPLYRFMPGLRDLMPYSRANWSTDLQAGLSVAAVALPVSIAYAQLAGLSPVTGLYSTVLPLLAYALFGSSRQMIVGPDAATCAMIAATLMPLAQPGSDNYHALSVTLTLLTGLACLVASRFRLGFLADFLSMPILVGLLNGVAISIVISQLGKLTGIAVSGGEILSQVLSFVAGLAHVHVPTLLVAAGTIGIFVAIKSWRRGAPAALAALACVSLANWALHLPTRGVAVIGSLPSGLPQWVKPALPYTELDTFLLSAVALALVSFSSAMLTARSFAVRNGYAVDGNQEFFAIGVADFASAACQGFAISGSSSRTAVNDAAGGRTRMVSVVAAVAVLVVLLFLTDLLAMVPIAALAAILVVSAIGLVDLGGLMAIRRYSRGEHAIALATLAGVVSFGVMSGILLAVTLALIRFLMQMARPADQRFGVIQGHDDFYELAHYPEARGVPGLMIYRFESPLTFFNADYFKRRVTQLVDTEMPRWVVIDAISIAEFDLTGMAALRDLHLELASRGIQLVIAGRTAQLLGWLRQKGLESAAEGVLFFPSRQAALLAYRIRHENLNADGET